ncbi:inner membrane complex protein [Gregarina niphandrodes]|uniref:Inner membrane complex protein n=1 Tax=Gregarina niphandrodes TaxID=110365 RepID=A0A023B4A2_GRENI|nr:inner membrane complex protein [Gregarina niphandrodes]EZG56482.1 inner membrane complex protein [Gregarina niphandrodes]|eukprot:XP_011131257.1 inner membrane complex protein [Gregarina niphandrodes]
MTAPRLTAPQMTAPQTASLSQPSPRQPLLGQPLTSSSNLGGEPLGSPSPSGSPLGRVLRQDYDPVSGQYIKYVEKLVPEERIVEIPVVQYVDVVKEVPDVQVKTVEKEVEELYVDEVVREVPIIHEEEVLKHVSVKKVVQVPVEKTVEKPVDTVVVREQVVEIPGEIIEQENHFEVQNKIVIPRYRDHIVPTVYRQIVQPEFKTVDSAVDVPVYDYDPVLCKVLVHIPKPVKQPVWFNGLKAQDHKWMSPNALSNGQYNGLVRSCNQSLVEASGQSDKYLTGLLLEDFTGRPIPSSNEPIDIQIRKPVPPLRLPKGPRPDPRVIHNSVYVNAIAREAGSLTRKPNPDFIPAIGALKTMRNFKYSDPTYERYLKDHHNYFGTTGQVLNSTRNGAVTARGMTPYHASSPPVTNHAGTPALEAESAPKRPSTERLGPVSRSAPRSRPRLETRSANHASPITSYHVSPQRTGSSTNKHAARKSFGADINYSNKTNLEEFARVARAATDCRTHRVHSDSPRKAPTIKL